MSKCIREWSINGRPHTQGLDRRFSVIYIFQRCVSSHASLKCWIFYTFPIRFLGLFRPHYDCNAYARPFSLLTMYFTLHIIKMGAIRRRPAKSILIIYCFLSLLLVFPPLTGLSSFPLLYLFIVDLLLVGFFCNKIEKQSHSFPFRFNDQWRTEIWINHWSRD